MFQHGAKELRRPSCRRTYKRVCKSIKARHVQVQFMLRQEYTSPRDVAVAIRSQTRAESQYVDDDQRKAKEDSESGMPKNSG